MYANTFIRFKHANLIFFLLGMIIIVIIITTFPCLWQLRRMMVFAFSFSRVGFSFIIVVLLIFQRSHSDRLVCKIALLALYLQFLFLLSVCLSPSVRVVLCVFTVVVGTDADLFLHANRSAIIQFFNFIALSSVCVCSRSLQVSECVNRVLFQVAFRVTMHYYSQPGNKSKPRQFHACNALFRWLAFSQLCTRSISNNNKAATASAERTEWILSAVFR